MTSLEIRLGNIEVMNRQIRRWTVNLQDMQPALQDVARMLADANRRNFQSEGAFGIQGKRWAPLSPAYRAWKEVHYPGQPILVRTGKLRDSLTRLPMGVQTTTRTSLVVGTDVPYAEYHQTGTPHMPARPPIQLTEQNRRDMVKILQRWIATGKGQ